MSYTYEMAEIEAKQFVDEYLKPALGQARDGGESLWRAVLIAVFQDAVYHGDATDIDFTDPLLQLAHEKTAPQPAAELPLVTLDKFNPSGTIVRQPPWRSGDC
jgi:hypothetical protein